MGSPLPGALTNLSNSYWLDNERLTQNINKLTSVSTVAYNSWNAVLSNNDTLTTNTADISTLKNLLNMTNSSLSNTSFLLDSTNISLANTSYLLTITNVSLMNTSILLGTTNISLANTHPLY